MKSPKRYRKQIPIFSNKSEAEYQKDPYERYDPMVIRQMALHLGDALWGHYPFQALLDFTTAYYPDQDTLSILELGCGIGKWIATLAKQYPGSTCWGIDYSYQMLKQAESFWIQGRDLELDYSNKGFKDPIHLSGQQIPNLQFGLSNIADLPFEANSQDLILNSFLLDRLDDPIHDLEILFGLLKPGGRIIICTPLNFQQAHHWRDYHPAEKLKTKLVKIGFEITAWKTDLIIHEPMDRHGNSIHWKCLGCVLDKV